MLDNKSNVDVFDFIVIGSGISGLTTAIILAKEGKRVAIFERDNDIAPLLRPYKRKNISISPGLHVCGWMDDGELVDCFFNYLNIGDGVERILSENGYGNVRLNGKDYYIPRGYEEIEKKLTFYFPESKEAIKNYINLVKECVDQVFYFNHSLPPLKNLHTSFIDSANYSLRDYLKRNDASDELIELLDVMSYILVGSKGEELPFLMHSFVMSGFFQSPGFFSVEGLNRMISNFKRELSRLGVRVFLNTEIDEILVSKDKTAIGVKTVRGENYYASNVVASFNPKLLISKLQNGVFRPIFVKRLIDAENTYGFYVAYYHFLNGVEITFDNFLFYDKSKELLIGVVLNKDKDKQTISIFMPEEKSISSEPEERKRISMEKLQIMENFVYDIIPDSKGNLELLDFLKPWSFEKYTKTVNGSAYGIKQKVDFIGFQHRIPIKNLYLVGHSICPGFLGAMISAFSLAFEVLESNKFWERVVRNEVK